jgi:hypothetical protein
MSIKGPYFRYVGSQDTEAATRNIAGKGYPIASTGTRREDSVRRLHVEKQILLQNIKSLQREYVAMNQNGGIPLVDR